MTPEDTTASLPIVRRAIELRKMVAGWRSAGETIGFVPTMGALHEGHLSLVAQALAETDKVIASVFVNPKQFSPGEDFDAYPRAEGRDARLLAQSGCALMFAPDVSEIYPPGFATTVSVAGVSEGLCGATRPNFFTGIATVVARLFVLVAPDKAFFGEKDYQQLLVIRRMVQDLGLPLEVVGCPIIRDEDGLALSSRNAYLGDEERRRALTLPRVLGEIVESLHRDGRARNVAAALSRGREDLEAAGFKLDYLEVRDAETLEPVADITRPARVLAGGYLGKTRLIDNMPVAPPA